jgi:hypothetical protein
MALTYARRAWRTFRAPENGGFGSPLVLVILTVLFFVVGAVILPSSDAPLRLPPSPTLDVRVSPPPRQLAVLSFLKQTGSSRAQLVVEASGQFSPGQAEVDWTVSVNGFTGTNCTPKAQHVNFISRGNDDYDMEGESPARPFGSLFFGFNLCWQVNSPLVVSGAYVSADLSAILSIGQTGTLTRSLELAGTALSAYTVTSGLAPTKVTLESWTWTSDLSSSFGSPASNSIVVTGSSISGIQSDSNHDLVAGIMFGVAGGAFVSIFPALFDAVSRRKAAAEAAARQDLPHQEPGACGKRGS